MISPCVSSPNTRYSSSFKPAALAAIHCPGNYMHEHTCRQTYNALKQLAKNISLPNTHLHQKLQEAISIKNAAAPRSAAHVLEPGCLRHRCGGEPGVGFDRIAHEHDWTELPGGARLAEFCVDCQHCKAQSVTISQAMNSGMRRARQRSGEVCNQAVTCDWHWRQPAVAATGYPRTTDAADGTGGWTARRKVNELP